MKNGVHSSILTAAVTAQTDLCYCIYTILFIFLCFRFPGWFAICSNDSCSTFQNERVRDSRNWIRLDVDSFFLHLFVCFMVLLYREKKLRKNNAFNHLVLIVFPFPNDVYYVHFDDLDELKTDFRMHNQCNLFES